MVKERTEAEWGCKVEWGPLVWAGEDADPDQREQIGTEPEYEWGWEQDCLRASILSFCYLKLSLGSFISHLPSTLLYSLPANFDNFLCVHLSSLIHSTQTYWACMTRQTLSQVLEVQIQKRNIFFPQEIIIQRGMHA